MKANTNRDGRLNFDVLVDAYDVGRPAFPTSLVGEIARAIGPVGRVLEIGAGTGQLTRALLDVGFQVVALEPGTHLADRLCSHVPEDRPLTISREFFEDYAGSAGSFSAIWAANSFHWIAPDVSYRKAASLLDSSGHLILLWNFPILRHDLQCALNDKVFSSLSPNLLRDPTDYRDRLVAETADGRQEMRDSGQFEEPSHWIATDVLK